MLSGVIGAVEGSVLAYLGCRTAQLARRINNERHELDTSARCALAKESFITGLLLSKVQS